MADLRELSDQALAERLKCEEPNYPLCNEAARRLSARGWQPMESAPNIEQALVSFCSWLDQPMRLRSDEFCGWRFWHDGTAEDVIAKLKAEGLWRPRPSPSEDTPDG